MIVVAQDGESALSTAACEGNVNIVKMLLDYRADVDFSNKVNLLLFSCS
jgi:ankyrin repeat protein